jgi:hypothetical protein
MPIGQAMNRWDDAQGFTREPGRGLRRREPGADHAMNAATARLDGHRHHGHERSSDDRSAHCGRERSPKLASLANYRLKASRKPARSSSWSRAPSFPAASHLNQIDAFDVAIATIDRQVEAGIAPLEPRSNGIDDQKARRTRSFRTGAQSAPAAGRFWPLYVLAENRGVRGRSANHVRKSKGHLWSPGYFATRRYHLRDRHRHEPVAI